MARRKYAPDTPCVWTRDDWDESWDTACGQKFQFSEGGPADNNQKYCGYCGRPIKEKRERGR